MGAPTASSSSEMAAPASRADAQPTFGPVVTSRHSVRSKHKCTLANVTNALPEGSLALANYLAAVYPHPKLTRRHCLQADPAVLQSWRWSEVDVIWWKFLPGSLRAMCHGRWPPWPERPAEPGMGMVYYAHGGRGCNNTVLDDFAVRNRPCDTLWVYRRPGGVCRGEKVEAGGRRAQPREARLSWTEVTHVYSGNRLEGAGLCECCLAPPCKWPHAHCSCATRCCSQGSTLPGALGFGTIRADRW